MAGARIASRDSRPNRAWASPQERTAPGTVIVSGPRRGSAVSPVARSAAASAPRAGPAGAVERDLPAGRGVPDQPERVAADAAAVRHDDAQDGVRGDRRVDGRAAGPQDREPGAGREVMRRDDRAARAAGERDRGPRPLGRSCRRDVVERGGRAGPPTSCSWRRSWASGTSATTSSTIVAISIPSIPRQSAAKPPIERADDLADGQEHRVEAHDRAAIGGEALGDVGEQAERRRRRAGKHEQADPAATSPARGTTNGSAGRG